jgi:hypothetical protein
MSAINQMMRAANPVPDPATALADDDFEALLLVSQTRSGKMDVKETMRPAEPETPRRSGWLIAAVAFAAIVVVVGAAALLMRPTDGVEPATTPPTTSAVEDAAITEGEALAIAHSYFAAYEGGDVDAMLGLFTPDAEIYVGPGYGLPELEQYIVWDLAQETTNSPPTCAVRGIIGSTVKVACDYTALQGISEAIGATPVPIELTFWASSDGIRIAAEGLGQPDFRAVRTPFKAWMNENHPEDTSGTDFRGWSTVEEAERNGLLRLQYGLEWAAYLKTQGCSYPDLDC